MTVTRCCRPLPELKVKLVRSVKRFIPITPPQQPGQGGGIITTPTGGTTITMGKENKLDGLK